MPLLRTEIPVLLKYAILALTSYVASNLLVYLYRKAVESMIGGAQMEQAAVRGARAAVIYDGGFAESGDDGKRLQQDLVALCREAGIALCGPNCMGFSSPHTSVHCYMLPLRDQAGFAGNVALIDRGGDPR